MAVDVISDIDPHNIGYTTIQAVNECKHKIELKLQKLAKYAVTLAKIEVKESQLNHQLKMDLLEGSGRKDSDFEQANRIRNKKKGN